MKIRLGYVSNSSSSSFLCSKDVSYLGIDCIKLTKAQIIAMGAIYDWDGALIHKLDPDKEYYITEYVSDCLDKYYAFKESEAFICAYDNGGHRGPYDEELYNEYNTAFSSVYIRKSDDVAEQMSFHKFYKSYMEAGHPREVIVEYKKDGVFLKWVY
jgi:hypothetical protein